MAEELRVSREPLCEALNALADQGLLTDRPNSGYFVAKRAPNELAQILHILQFLENELLVLNGRTANVSKNCAASTRKRGSACGSTTGRPFCD